MNNKSKEFYEWAKKNDWSVIDNIDCAVRLEDVITMRYKSIPDEYLNFLKLFKQLISSNEKTWFLCCDEYNDNSDIAFKWNEFELLSLEAAQDDEEWTAEIIKWWNGKIPIVMSVENGYSFYAIDLVDNIGSVVRGEEPEFEETEKIANDFNEFLDLIMLNAIEL